MPLTDKGEHKGWMIFCPACKCGHLFDKRWTFNGDQEKPTFRASYLVHHVDGYNDPKTGEVIYKPTLRCHNYVTDGNIQFLSDCEHEMANQTVPLPEWD